LSTGTRGLDETDRKLQLSMPYVEMQYLIKFRKIHLKCSEGLRADRENTKNNENNLLARAICNINSWVTK